MVEKLEKNPPICKKCDNIMSIKDKIDLIAELSQRAESKGTKIELISTDSEEGESLLKTFGGIAAILRYRINSAQT